MFFIFNCYLLFLFIIVIQTTEGRKNLGNINVDVHEILRFALDDKWFIHPLKHPLEAPSPLCGQG